MLSNFFLNRPVFAWVIAIIIMVFGGLAIHNLPISQYPPIAPPSIAITAGPAHRSPATAVRLSSASIVRPITNAPTLMPT